MVVGLIAGGPDGIDARHRGGGGRPRPRRRRHRLPGRRARTTWSSGSPPPGRTPYVLGAVREARRRGAATVGLACNRPSLLAAEVDLEIAPLVGAEVIAGSTRLKAGTATKMILNMISTGAMVQIGKTLGNRMVDLRPTNEKLRSPAGASSARSPGSTTTCPRDPVALRGTFERGAGRRPDRRRARRGRIAPAGARRPGTRGDQGRDRREFTLTSWTSMTRGQSRMTERLLGVDGGGTATEAWLAEPGLRVIGRGTSGPSNAKAVGLDAAARALDAAIGAAFRDAGLEPAPVAAACLGLAGFDRPDDRRILIGWADEARRSTGWCWSTTATSWSRPARRRAGASG